MPAVSERQARYMRMCAHQPGKAKKKCPPKSVAREFMNVSDARRRIRSMTK